MNSSNLQGLVTAQSALAQTLSDRGRAHPSVLAGAAEAHASALSTFEEAFIAWVQGELNRAGEIVASALLKAAAVQDSLGGMGALAVLHQVLLPNVDAAVRRINGPNLVTGYSAAIGDKTFRFRAGDWKEDEDLVALATVLAESKRLRSAID